MVNTSELNEMLPKKYLGLDVSVISSLEELGWKSLKVLAETKSKELENLSAELEDFSKNAKTLIKISDGKLSHFLENPDDYEYCEDCGHLVPYTNFHNEFEFGLRLPEFITKSRCKLLPKEYQNKKSNDYCCLLLLSEEDFLDTLVYNLEKEYEANNFKKTSNDFERIVDSFTNSDTEKPLLLNLRNKSYFGVGENVIVYVHDEFIPGVISKKMYGGVYVELPFGKPLEFNDNDVNIMKEPEFRYLIENKGFIDIWATDLN